MKKLFRFIVALLVSPIILVGISTYYVLDLVVGETILADSFVGWKKSITFGEYNERR